MEKIYEKLKQMPEEQFVKLQKFMGALAGVLCWVALRAGSFFEDNLIGYLMLGLCVVVILGSRMIGRKIERPIRKFELFLALSLGVCIAIFALVTFVLSPYVFTDGEKKGLIELIFNIPV